MSDTKVRFCSPSLVARRGPHMHEYKIRMDGFLRAFRPAGMSCKSLAWDIISLSASLASSSKTQPSSHKILSSCNNRPMYRLCCCTGASCAALPELAAPYSEKSSALSAKNVCVRHRCCLFEAGCSSPSKVVLAVPLFCLLAALGFACGCCSSA